MPTAGRTLYGNRLAPKTGYAKGKQLTYEEMSQRGFNKALDEYYRLLALAVPDPPEPGASPVWKFLTCTVCSPAIDLAGFVRVLSTVAMWAHPILSQMAVLLLPLLLFLSAPQGAAVPAIRGSHPAAAIVTSLLPSATTARWALGALLCTLWLGQWRRRQVEPEPGLDSEALGRWYRDRPPPGLPDAQLKILQQQTAALHAGVYGSDAPAPPLASREACATVLKRLAEDAGMEVPTAAGKQASTRELLVLAEQVRGVTGIS